MEIFHLAEWTTARDGQALRCGSLIEAKRRDQLEKALIVQARSTHGVASGEGSFDPGTRLHDQSPNQPR